MSYTDGSMQRRLSRTRLMISEGSRDTEDWSNGYSKSIFVITGMHQMFKSIQKHNNIKQYYCF